MESVAWDVVCVLVAFIWARYFFFILGAEKIISAYFLPHNVPFSTSSDMQLFRFNNRLHFHLALCEIFMTKFGSPIPLLSNIILAEE